MYDEKQKKGGTHCLGLPHGRLNGGARVSNVLGCICKDGLVIGMAKQDNRHHCYLSTILSVRTGVPGALSSWKIH
jgi:hypothetical protein